MNANAPHCQVRDYKAPSAEGGEMSGAQVEQLKRDVESKKTGLEQWSKTAFEEVRVQGRAGGPHGAGAPRTRRRPAAGAASTPRWKG